MAVQGAPTRGDGLRLSSRSASGNDGTCAGRRWKASAGPLQSTSVRPAPLPPARQSAAVSLPSIPRACSTIERRIFWTSCSDAISRPISWRAFASSFCLRILRCISPSTLNTVLEKTMTPTAMIAKASQCPAGLPSNGSRTRITQSCMAAKKISGSIMVSHFSRPRLMPYFTRATGLPPAEGPSRTRWRPAPSIGPAVGPLPELPETVLVAKCEELVAGDAPPLEVVELFGQGDVAAQGRQVLEQRHVGAPGGEALAEPGGAPHDDVPAARVRGDILNVTVSRQDGRRRPGPPARQARVAVRRVADER